MPRLTPRPSSQNREPLALRAVEQPQLPLREGAPGHRIDWVGPSHQDDHRRLHDSCSDRRRHLVCSFHSYVLYLHWSVSRRGRSRTGFFHVTRRIARSGGSVRREVGACVLPQPRPSLIVNLNLQCAFDRSGINSLPPARATLTEVCAASVGPSSPVDFDPAVRRSDEARVGTFRIVLPAGDAHALWNVLLARTSALPLSCLRSLRFAGSRTHATLDSFGHDRYSAPETVASSYSGNSRPDSMSYRARSSRL